MKKYIVSLAIPVAVLSLAIAFFVHAQKMQAQVANCPAGYTCTPIAAQPVGCPVGYTCTLVSTPISSPSPIRSCYFFQTNIQLGANGVDVSALQGFLISHGFAGDDLTVNGTYGYFGNSTFLAIKKYQAGNGLPSTGFFGPLTRASINSSCATMTTPSTQAPVSVSSGTSIIPIPSNPSPTISVTSPNNGETLIIGTPYTVTWTSQGLTGNVLVLLSNSTGDTSCTIGTALAQSHQYVYTPTLNSCLKRPGQYKIQVAKMSPTGGFDFNVEAFSNGTIAISAPNLSTTPVVVPTVVITNPPVTQVQITSASITPTQATINSNNPYVFNLAYPSNATDATISVSCPSFVGGPSCNTGPTHVLGSNSWPLAMFYQMSTSSQQVTVTYNVFSPQGNTSAQAMVTVQPMGR